MKQSPLAPLGTPLAIRLSNNSSGVAGITGTTAGCGVTYVLHQSQQQQSKPGVLRPVSFVPQLAQQQQINGCGVVGGSGGQVLIRRFPNNNVVHVRRIVSQQQQPQHRQQVQKVVVQQATPGGNITVTTSLNKNGTPRPQQQQQPSISITKTRRGDDQLASSEPDSDEPDNEGVEIRRNGDSKSGSTDFEELNGNESDEDKTYNKLLITGKRKRVAVEENDEEDGDLLVDHHMEDDDEDDQDGDVIDDNDGEEGDGKSALELNGAGVDSGFLRHVVETQILNRHKTRIQDWDGTKGNMCQSCHESFLSESGLETHRNRRIHHILFFCRYCKRDLSFFNKCRLLQHLRNHRVQPTVSSLQNHTIIRLLPESEYLHFKYEDCTSSSDDDEDDKISSPVSTTGGGNSSGSGGTSKRLKPSRFRRIPRSSVTGRDSDNSPPPTISRQIVAPPQLSSPPPLAEDSTTTIVSTLNNTSNCASSAVVVAASTVATNAVGTIKFASSSGGGGPAVEESIQQKSSQIAVIKSTGKTTSVILPSPTYTNPATTPAEKEVSPATESSDNPQIRIRNLSQITVSMNDDEDNNNDNYDEFEGEDDDDDDDKLVIAPVIQSPILPPNIVSTSENSVSTSPVIVTKKEYCCYKCDKIFRLASELFKHLEEAEQVGLSSRSLHRCPTDDIPSWSQCQYVFHTKVFHEKSVPFMCPGCGDESPDYNSLLEHVTNDCFYLSQRARYMCAATVAKCSFSDRKSVKTEPEIIDHLKKEHSRSVLQCLHCTQGFATDNWLLKHLAETHGIQCDESKDSSERETLINKTTRPLTQCLICNILFPNGPTYLQHVYLNFHMHILHAKMLECQNCLAVFETHEEILAHRKENEACRKLDPFQMKISESSAGNEDVNGGEQMSAGTAIAPTPIKIMANPSATVTSTPQPGQQPPQLIQNQLVTSRSQPVVGGTATVVTVISSAGVQPPTLSPQVTPTRSQGAQQNLSTNKTNSSQMIPTSQQQNNSIRNVVTTASSNNKNGGKKTIFDDLLSCQFCERLVVFSSLRKHEDQCCGLSTVDPGYCLTCKQYFGDKTRLARHGIVHIKEGLPICLFCNNRHIRPTHPKSTTPSAHENLYALKKHLYSNHTSKIVQFPFKCTICSAWCADKRACEFHIKDHQFKFRVKPDEPDPSPVEMSLEELQKMVKVRRKGVDPRKKATTKTIEVYYCPVCKNREFALESGLARHLKLVHQKNPKSLNLSLLKKASTARRFVVKAPETAGSILSMTIQQHQQTKPFLRSVSSGSSSTLVSTATPKSRNVASPTGPGSNNAVTVSSSSGGNSFISRFSSSIVLRKRLVSTATTSTTARKVGSVGGGNIPQRQPPNTRQRSASTTATNNPSSNSSSNSRPPSNFLQTRLSSVGSASSSKSCRRKDGTIACLKCPEFSCKSENEFCEHIKWKHVWPDSEIQKLKFGNKLEEPSEYWCPECNTMFVAKPSLVRHLKFAHDYISSAEEYMQKIGYDGKKPLKPHQCEVCYYQCADDREHQQHIRTHGMAFLRLRQQRQMSMTKK